MSRFKTFMSSTNKVRVVEYGVPNGPHFYNRSLTVILPTSIVTQQHTSNLPYYMRNVNSRICLGAVCYPIEK